MEADVPGRIPRVTSVRVVRGRIVHLVFDDGVEGDVDLSDLDYGVFAEITRDDAKFAEVYVDTEWDTICWPGTPDLAPEVLYEDVIAGQRQTPANH
jgi:uncharacterized protein DUF2442